MINLERILRIVDAGINAAKTSTARFQLEDVRVVAEGYAEPGYGTGDDVVVLGNWNDDTRWDRETCKPVTTDNTPSRVARLLEKAGATLEWGDEWTTCSECGKAIRTSPDSYGWTRSYVETEDGCVCEDCTLETPESYLESLEGDAGKAITLDVSPESYGYTRLDKRFENGLYGGQAADPRKIAEILEEREVHRFIFKIDSVGQFDLKFSVFVHDDEMGLLEDVDDLFNGEEDGPDPAVMMERALRNIPSAPAGEGVAYSKIDLSTGTATTRRVSPEEFIQGIKD